MNKVLASRGSISLISVADHNLLSLINSGHIFCPTHNDENHIFNYINMPSRVCVCETIIFLYRGCPNFVDPKEHQYWLSAQHFPISASFG